MPSDDKDKVARLTSSLQSSRARSDTASGASGREQVIQVATRCATIDEFVERFAAFAWESSLVLPAATALPVGTQGRFVILLKDQSVAMRGRCRVTEAKPTPVSTRNPAVKKIMMRVALLEMDEASRVVHKRLIALRSAPVPLPIPPEPSETTQIEPARGGTAPSAAAPPPAAERPAAPSPPPARAAALAPPLAAPRAGPPPAASTAPVPPVKTPAAPAPVSLNRTMIGVGIGPDGKALLRHPTPRAVPPLAMNPAIGMGTLGGSPNPPAMVRGEQSSPAPHAIVASPPPVVPPTAVQNIATAATMIMTPSPAARSAMPARVETRAPRAPETLPANPLSEFDADEVDNFIECMLVEAADAPGAHAPDGPTSTDAPLTAAAAAVRRTTAFVRIQQLAAKLPPGVRRNLLRVGPSVGAVVATLIVGYFLFHRSPAVPPPPVVARAANVEVAPAPAPVKPALARPAPAPAPVGKPIEKRPAAAAAAAGPAAAPAPAKTLAVAEKPAPPARPAAAAAPPAAEKPAAEPEEQAAARPVVSAGTPGACTARVITEPKDAKVIWGEQVIGRSPIAGARVPCGAAKVTIERERWQPVTVDVSMQSGEEAVVRQRLHRPHATLAISTSPQGAQISVDHAFVGAAPQRLESTRYQKVAIKAALKGYQTWNKSVYLREAETKLDIQLVPKR